MRSERDDHLDAVIDDAARSLTAGEPSAELRVGVRARVGDRSLVASAFRRRSSGWLVPAGAAAAVLVAALVGRALLGPPGGPDVGRTLSGSPAGPADVRLSIDLASMQSVSRIGGPDVGHTLSRLSGGPDKARPTGVLTATRPVAETFELPPVEELEPLIPPITIEPLETKLIAVGPSSGVMPIEIEPLRIEPLQGASEE